MARVKKIVFMVYNPFNKRDYERFGIEIMRQNGFDVEVWDFAPFLKSRVYKQTDKQEIADFDGYRPFPAMKEAEAAILSLDAGSFVFCFMFYLPATYKIYRLLSKKNLRYCVDVLTVYPMSCIQRNKKIWHFVKDMLLKNNYRKIINYIFPRIPFEKLGIKPADFILASGSKAQFYTYPVNDRTEIIWGHYYDYDLYLREIKKALPAQERIGVFLDEYLPYNWGWENNSFSFSMSAENYYASIRNFFDALEMNSGVKIIIAAHPSSHYDRYPDYFGRRTVLKGETISLVRKAEFVVTHASFSTNFAVLFKKPVIFVTNNALNQTIYREGIKLMAGLLGKKPVNIDQDTPVDLEKELVVDEEKYNNYKHCYIKRDKTEELPLCQIAANRIKAIT